MSKEFFSQRLRAAVEEFRERIEADYAAALEKELRGSPRGLSGQAGLHPALQEMLGVRSALKKEPSIPRGPPPMLVLNGSPSDSLSPPVESAVPSRSCSFSTMIDIYDQHDQIAKMAIVDENGDPAADDSQELADGLSGDASGRDEGATPDEDMKPKLHRVMTGSLKGAKDPHQPDDADEDDSESSSVSEEDSRSSSERGASGEAPPTIQLSSGDGGDEAMGAASSSSSFIGDMMDAPGSSPSGPLNLRRSNDNDQDINAAARAGDSIESGVWKSENGTTNTSRKSLVSVTSDVLRGSMSLLSNKLGGSVTSGHGSRRHSSNHLSVNGKRKQSISEKAAHVVKSLVWDDSKDDDDSDSEDEKDESLQHRRSRTSIRSNDSNDDVVKFFLHPNWVERCQTRLGKASLQIPKGEERERCFSEGVEVNDKDTMLGHVMSGLMVNPRSIKCFVWMMIGCALVFWDTVMIPLLLFDNTESWTFLTAMSWAGAVYWTATLFLSLVTGRVILHENIEMRPERVIFNYARTWMLFDVGMVIMDWRILATESRFNENVGVLRLLRILRCRRNLQSKNLPEKVRILLMSNRITKMAGLFEVCIEVLIVNHWIACFWYRVGDSSDADSWLVDGNWIGASLGDVYSVSLLWSLSQFTGNMDNKVPVRLYERIFAVFVLMFTFVFSAFAISSITSSMTQLQIISAQKARKFDLLRQYLRGNHISKELSLRIHRSAHTAVEQLERRTPEDTVVLLALVSEPLRIELRHEVFAPIIMVHPFFKHYNVSYIHAMKQICHEALTRTSLQRGDVLFSCGEMPPEEDMKMFFVMDGRLEYMRRDVYKSTVKPGSYMCEPALWCMWPFFGTCSAKSDCTLCILDAMKFQKIASKFVVKGINPVQYGKELVKFLNGRRRHDLTDLAFPQFSAEATAVNVMYSVEVEPVEAGRKAPRLSFGGFGNEASRAILNLTNQLSGRRASFSAGDIGQHDDDAKRRQSGGQQLSGVEAVRRSSNKSVSSLLSNIKRRVSATGAANIEFQSISPLPAVPAGRSIDEQPKSPKTPTRLSAGPVLC